MWMRHASVTGQSRVRNSIRSRNESKGAEPEAADPGRPCSRPSGSVWPRLMGERFHIGLTTTRCTFPSSQRSAKRYSIIALYQTVLTYSASPSDLILLSPVVPRKRRKRASDSNSEMQARCCRVLPGAACRCCEVDGTGQNATERHLDRP